MYDHGVSDLTAFVLAGGKSTRMGSNKAFLRWGQGTLLTHALQLVGSVAANVWVVGDAKEFAGFGSVVEDVFRNRGPLGGIHAALSRSATELNLMLAVDLPFLRRRFLHYLVERARESGATVTVPRAGGRLQPLCATYHKEFAQRAEQSLQAGKNKIDALFEPGSTRILEEEELALAGFSAGMFRNLNTPEQWHQAQGRPGQAPEF